MIGVGEEAKAQAETEGSLVNRASETWRKRKTAYPALCVSVLLASHAHRTIADVFGDRPTGENLSGGSTFLNRLSGAHDERILDSLDRPKLSVEWR